MMIRSMGTKPIIALAMASMLAGGCATGPKEDPYVLYRELMPRSILVLPPINESVDVNATYSWLTTASEPIGEKGYYVFPVAIVDEFLKENGLPNPEDMHAAPLDKLDEVFGADAVLYVTVEDYGQKFKLVSSDTVVRARAELVDIKSGQSIWQNRVNYSRSGSGSQQGGLLAAIVVAAVEQAGNTINDAAHDATRFANAELLDSRSRGLLLGPLNPGFEEQMAAAAEAEAAAAEAAAAEEAAEAAKAEGAAQEAAAGAEKAATAESGDAATD